MSDPNHGFLPEDYIEKKNAYRTNLICVSLFVVVLVAVVGAFFVTDHQRTQVREELNAVNQQFEDRAQRIKQIENLQTQKQAMMHKARVTAQLVERIPRPILFSELINHMPASLTLEEIELETKVLRGKPAQTALQKAKKAQADKAKKTGEDGQEKPVIVPKEVNLTLVGISPTHQDISMYQKALTDLPLFSSVNLERIEAKKIDKKELLEFELNLKLDQEVDISRHEPARIARGLNQDPLSGKVAISAEGEFVAPPNSAQATVPVD